MKDKDRDLKTIEDDILKDILKIAEKHKALITIEDITPILDRIHTPAIALNKRKYKIIKGRK